MIALAIVIAALLLIALLRVGVRGEYGESGVSLYAHIGPVRLRILPAKEKREKKAKKKPKEKEKKPGTLADFRSLLPDILKALGRFRRRLLIKKLVLYYEAAGDDPASTAINFGRLSAGLGALFPLLDYYFRIRRRDIRTTVNFAKDEPYIYVSATLSLAVWEIVYIAAGLLLALLRKNTEKPKTGKEVKENG